MESFSENPGEIPHVERKYVESKGLKGHNRQHSGQNIQKLKIH